MSMLKIVFERLLGKLMNQSSLTPLIFVFIGGGTGSVFVRGGDIVIGGVARQAANDEAWRMAA